jgi:hypothetical protein
MKIFRLRTQRAPELIAFDHLRSEYVSDVSNITEPSDKNYIEQLSPDTVTWHDLYAFELILAKYLPFDRLPTKIMRLRSDYRDISSQKEFDDYLASKPPDIQSPPAFTDPPNPTRKEYEDHLREDLQDLLSRVYLEYTILPVREERLTDLTWLAAKLCLIAQVLLLLILAVLFLLPLAYEVSQSSSDGIMGMVATVRSSDKLSALTIFVVVVSGAMGGFVSALQRIQSPPSDGDSLYNLSLLFHGSKSVFVAPISGSIFAILLYMMFTSGILTGTFFPSIYTPPGTFTESVSPPAAVLDPAKNSNADGTPPAAPLTGKAEPSPTPRPVPQQGINVFDFLARSGPGRGSDYALLIVWCFIAGFAERFVPDALDRVISKNSGGAGGG